MRRSPPSGGRRRGRLAPASRLGGTMTETRRLGGRGRVLAALGVSIMCLGATSITVGITDLAAPATPAGAANGYGPGIGPQAPTQHWGGAYVLTGVPGYAYCIDPGTASPTELPTTHWNPVAYPGSSVFSNGQMAALAYFAERYQGTGWNGYSVNTTVAAIAQIAYASAGGTTPPGSRAPAALVAAIIAWITTYAGPWTISLTMTPPSGSTFSANRNYSGTVTVRSATGAGVGGLQITAAADRRARGQPDQQLRVVGRDNQRRRTAQLRLEHRRRPAGRGVLGPEHERRRRRRRHSAPGLRRTRRFGWPADDGVGGQRGSGHQLRRLRHDNVHR